MKEGSMASTDDEDEELELNLNKLKGLDQVSEKSEQDEFKKFSAEDIPEIVKLFNKYDADGSGGLDIFEFTEAMTELFKNVDPDELKCLHMKIDTNCDETVDISELLDFLLRKSANEDSFRNKLFPRPAEKVNVTTAKLFAKIICLTSGGLQTKEETTDESSNSVKQIRPYVSSLYLTIASNGVLKYCAKNFQAFYNIPLYEREIPTPKFHNKRKVHINDAVYITELEQLAVSLSDRELLFYNCPESASLFCIKYCLMEHESTITTLDYWSNGTKAMFAMGDSHGFLSIFVSCDIMRHGLFNKKQFEESSRWHYPVAYVSSLLQNKSKDFVAVRISVFRLDSCSHIRYFPTLSSYVICGESCVNMIVVTFPIDGITAKTLPAKTFFRSRRFHNYFVCAEYSPSSQFLVTGGKDGILRVWFPHKPSTPEHLLEGHKRSLTHLLYNPLEKVFISISMDQNLRVWADDTWICRQSFFIDGIKKNPISCVCYNLHNNELYVANSEIAKYFGSGTQRFLKTLTSHSKPVCSSLYHHIYKQIISVALTGAVKVWDVLTGKILMEIQVTPLNSRGKIILALDEPQRQLITGTHDGRVRLWNFNTGEQLTLHPVKIPYEMSSIVCSRDYIFVSTKTSSIIFMLDLKGKEHFYLKHELINEVCSLQLHEDTLFAASADGRVIVWDLESLVATCLNIPGNQHPLSTPLKEKGFAGLLTSDFLHELSFNEPAKRKSSKACSVALSLARRENRPDKVTLLTTVGGNILAWALSGPRPFRGDFQAVQAEEAIITTMCANITDTILVTGESLGRVCVWDIQTFKTETQKGGAIFLEAPPLRYAWMASSSELVTVMCDPDCKNIISTGVDCKIKIWTSTGQFVGLFGKDHWDSTIIPKSELGDHIEESSEDSDEEEDAEEPRDKTASKRISIWEIVEQRQLDIFFKYSVLDGQYEDDVTLDQMQEDNYEMKEDLNFILMRINAIGGAFVRKDKEEKQRKGCPSYRSDSRKMYRRQKQRSLTPVDFCGLRCAGQGVSQRKTVKATRICDLLPIRQNFQPRYIPPPKRATSAQASRPGTDSSSDNDTRKRYEVPGKPRLSKLKAQSLHLPKLQGPLGPIEASQRLNKLYKAYPPMLTAQ